MPQLLKLKLIQKAKVDSQNDAKLVRDKWKFYKESLKRESKDGKHFYSETPKTQKVGSSMIKVLDSLVERTVRESFSEKFLILKIYRKPQL